MALIPQDTKAVRIAWLLPAIRAGAHWQPILSGFLDVFKDTVFYTTSVWKEFDQQAPYAGAVRQVGAMKSIFQDKSGSGYHHGFLVLPLNIIFRLAEFKPGIVIANAFSLWSLIAVIFKPMFKWRIIILYEGSTPSSDFRDSKSRLLSRKFISRHSDVFIANTKCAKQYLCEFLEVDPEKVVLGPYLLPDRTLMDDQSEKVDFDFSRLARPIFLYVGQIINRKGLFNLIEACSHLKAKGICDYTLLVVGEGEDRVRFQEDIHTKRLSNQIHWLGRVSYDQLGTYYQESDVFIFPTFEDTWGMVPLEAMAFGMPVICSKHAGSSELVIDAENGYIIESKSPEDIANKMSYFIGNQELSQEMGQRAEKLMARYTIDASIKVFSKAISMAA